MHIFTYLYLVPVSGCIYSHTCTWYQYLGAYIHIPVLGTGMCVWVCRHLGSQLAEMERAIERMMEADLVHFALEDIALKVMAIGNPSLVSDISSSEVLYMYIHVYALGVLCCFALSFVWPSLLLPSFCISH